MSINIWTDSMQHAALLGKPVLFTNWLNYYVYQNTPYDLGEIQRVKHE